MVVICPFQQLNVYKTSMEIWVCRLMLLLKLQSQQNATLKFTWHLPSYIIPTLNQPDLAQTFMSNANSPNFKDFCLSQLASNTQPCSGRDSTPPVRPWRWCLSQTAECINLAIQLEECTCTRLSIPNVDSIFLELITELIAVQNYFLQLPFLQKVEIIDVFQLKKTEYVHIN